MSSKLTTLGLSDAQPSPRQQRLAPRSTRCPQCGAPDSVREKVGGFGMAAADEKTLCGNCGYEFQDGQ